MPPLWRFWGAEHPQILCPLDPRRRVRPLVMKPLAPRPLESAVAASGLSRRAPLRRSRRSSETDSPLADRGHAGRRVVRAQITEVRRCDNHGLLRDPAARGEVAMGFTIGQTTKVPVADVFNTNLKDATVGNCGPTPEILGPRGRWGGDGDGSVCVQPG